MTPSAKSLGKRKAEELDSDDDSNNREAALAALQANGQTFLQSFGSVAGILSSNHPKESNGDDPQSSDGEEDETEQWSGISDLKDDDDELPHIMFRRVSNDDRPSVPTSESGDVVVFTEAGTRSHVTTPSKGLKRLLMSSKVSRIHTTEQVSTDDKRNEAASDEEKTNAENDKALYKLLHTKLLTGNADAAAEMTPAERRRALQGRVLELSGGARIGQGVKVLRHQYKVHQPKRERDLLEAKERRIDAARRKDAEDAGTYDKSFKKSLFIQKKKQRDWTKGLGPGIGKFSGGVLKISGAEITSVMGPKEGSTQTGKPKYHAKRRK